MMKKLGIVASKWLVLPNIPKTGEEIGSKEAASIGAS